MAEHLKYRGPAKIRDITGIMTARLDKLQKQVYMRKAESRVARSKYLNIVIEQALNPDAPEHTVSLGARAVEDWKQEREQALGRALEKYRESLEAHESAERTHRALKAKWQEWQDKLPRSIDTALDRLYGLE